MSSRIKNIGIESDLFKIPRMTLDNVIKRTIERMIRKESDEATVTLKIGISLEETKNSDCLPDSSPAKWTPQFKCDVTSKISNNFKLEAPVQSKGHLYYDEERDCWVVIDGDPQMTIEDFMDEEEKENE